ncbi:MAG TPA: ferrous iron transport protein B [Bacteroidota bacterium]|nr:ferrous iron transport protein B [Bacteroidota bacterium]
MHIAVMGNPNSGKTSIFNALTGLRQKVANYPGVTIEKKEGKVRLPDGTDALLIDLPGTYSLFPNSPDEEIASEVVLGRYPSTPAPSKVLCVVDSNNLERNLYLATQLIDHTIPVVIALNMIDLAEKDGKTIDAKRLSEDLGVPVVPTAANSGRGIPELRQALASRVNGANSGRLFEFPEAAKRECSAIEEELMRRYSLTALIAHHDAVSLLTAQELPGKHAERYDEKIIARVRAGRDKLDFLGIDRQSVFIEGRYARINQICDRAVSSSGPGGRPLSDRIDHILTHRVWGFMIFLALMTLMFVAVFTWAEYPMRFITAGFDALGALVTGAMPPGDLRDLIVKGVIAGVGAVVTFIPQILALFFFISVLEDSGYMSRAAFIMDKVMGKVGLHGKAFIPLLGSFACAIPGIMATRTIESHKDRLITMMIAPLMGCSARLPVYTLLIAAFIPERFLLGFLPVQGLTMAAMYILGIVFALVMALIFKQTVLRGDKPAFVMELPPYRLPSFRTIGLIMVDRGKVFLQNAGTFILGVSIVLWFLASYPKIEGATPPEQLERSYAGRMGKLIEPAIEPLGFNWKIGIGLIGSLLQREVFVSTMGTIFNIGDTGNEAGATSLREKMVNDADPATGDRSFSMLTAICLMVWYALSMQCLSTVAIMKRETNGWKWPLIQIGYMTLLAYGVTWLVFSAGQAAGLG